jgi:hypothetical protein
VNENARGFVRAGVGGMPMNCLSRREFNKRAAAGFATAFGTAPRFDGLATAEIAAGGTEKIDLAILILPEVLPPWEHLDYDVREQYLHTGASNLTYVVRHLECLCHNLGLSVRRAQIDELENLHPTVLLVPDASRMLPETRAALNKWIIQNKPVIVFGEVPQKWALQYGIEVVGARRSSYNRQGHITIYFPSGNLSIAGEPSNYATYIAGEPIALLMDSGNTRVRCTFVCRRGSLLLCGWSPRLHFWEVIAEQDELRFFARLLNELQIDVTVPQIPKERISNLKSLGVSDWGLWKDLTPADSLLAGYGFDHIYQYDSYFSRIFDRKFEETLLGVPLTLQLKSESSSNQLGYLQKLITPAHNSKLKVYVVINPFSISYSPCLYNELLQRDGLQYRYTDGVLHPTHYWSPANPELTRLAIESLREFLAQQNVDGIFIDFARYLDGKFDYAPAMRKLFEKQVGTRIDTWPKDVIDDPDLARSYAGFKRHVMNSFLGEFGLTAKKIQKEIVVEALYYWDFWPDPGGAYEAIGQDPKPLINMGALDRACGMFYTSDNTQLEALVDHAIKDVGRDAFGCIIAPISFFNEYNTTHQIFDQIQILKNKGVRHASIYSHIPDHLLYNRFENGERISG